MKKLRYIILILILLLLATLCFFKCKEVKGLESGFVDYNISISERDLEHYGYVAIYGLHLSNINDYNFNYIYGNDEVIFINNYHDDVNVYRYTSLNGYVNLTNFTSQTGFIQVNVDLDNNQLCLVIYELNVDVQHTQGVQPVASGIIRTLKARIELGNGITGIWSDGDLTIKLLQNNVSAPNFLLNYSYFEYGDSVNVINNWVDNQSFINLLFNKVAYYGYLAGNDDGYQDGFDDGEDRGYSDGYDAGESAGYLSGFLSGKDEGLAQGDIIGYNRGYADGAAGNNAVHPLWAIIRDIAGGIGDILALQLGPGITIGTIIFVPLFFSALGLILWIWRRN